MNSKNFLASTFGPIYFQSWRNTNKRYNAKQMEIYLWHCGTCALSVVYLLYQYWSFFCVENPCFYHQYVINDVHKCKSISQQYIISSNNVTCIKLNSQIMLRFSFIGMTNSLFRMDCLFGVLGTLRATNAKCEKVK